MADVKRVTDLKPDGRNRRRHNARNIAMIREALSEVGAARSIVIDENNVILAGNGVIEAAQGAGIERVRVIEANGNEIIAVRRSGLSEEQKRRLSLFDNRAAELADWNVDQIIADLNEGLDFDGIFDEDEMHAILGAAADDLLAGAPAKEGPEGVEFPEYDESVAKDVEYITCPKCGYQWPK